MKKLISSILFLALCSLVYAQNYNTALGLRVSNGIGITVQQRVADKVTVEGIAFATVGRTYLGVLGEYHGKLIRKGFNWYTGAGVHTGTQGNAAVNPKGMLFIAGLEMKIKRIVISADVMPMANFVGGTNTFEFNPGFSARYILIERPKTGIKDRLKDRFGKNN